MRIGRLIGTGAFGCVFEYGPSKVIKIEPVCRAAVSNYIALLGWVVETRPEYIVRVHDFGEIVPSKRILKILKRNLDGESPHGTFFYVVMERLVKRLVKCHDESFEKTWDVATHVHPVYSDDHDGNIMVDGHGNPKVIDFGGFFAGNAPFDALNSDRKNELLQECGFLKVAHEPSRRHVYDSVEEFDKKIRYMTPVDHLLARLG